MECPASTDSFTYSTIRAYEYTSEFYTPYEYVCNWLGISTNCLPLQAAHGQLMVIPHSGAAVGADSGAKLSKKQCIAAVAAAAVAYHGLTMLLLWPEMNGPLSLSRAVLSRRIFIPKQFIMGLELTKRRIMEEKGSTGSPPPQSTRI